MLKKPEDCTDDELRPYAAEYARRKATGRSNKPKVLRPCPVCGELFGARELKAHRPHCPKAKAPGQPAGASTGR